MDIIAKEAVQQVLSKAVGVISTKVVDRVGKVKVSIEYNCDIVKGR